MFGLGIREYLIIGMFAALLALGWYAKYETEQVGAEHSARLTAEQVATNNAGQIEVLQAAMIERDRVTAAQLAKEAAGRRRAESIIEEINHAEDGPVAPALAIALDRLRNGDGPAGSEGAKGAGAGSLDRASR